MRSVRRFFGWFFLVIGVFGFFQQPISGLVFMSWGVLLLPFTNQFAANRGWHLNLWKRLGIAFIGFVLVGLTAPNSQTPQIAVSPTPSPFPTTTSSPDKGSTPSQSNSSNQSPETTVRDFKTLLPPENEELRNFILSDPWLGGFLQNVWIGNATKADLINRGFYINILYKHTGDGEGSAATAKGACSPIGFNGAFICGRGMMQPYQWGIQSDEAIARLNVLEEEWANR